jgi:hypothetical protein
MAKQDLQCPFCPKTSSRGTGLASHIRGTHPKQYKSWSKARKTGGGAERKSGASATGGSPKSAISGDGFGAIVASLERQRDAIEAALSALREVGDVAAPSTPKAGKPARKKRKGHMSPEGKARLIAALKKRWAAKKAASA